MMICHHLMEYVSAVFVLRIILLFFVLCLTHYQDSGSEVFFEEDRESARLLRRQREETHRRLACFLEPKFYMNKFCQEFIM